SRQSITNSLIRHAMRVLVPAWRPGHVRVLRTTGTGTSALRRQWWAEPQVVAAGVAGGGVTNAVGLVDGLLEDLRPGGTQRFEGLVQVVNLDEDRQVALGDNLAHRLSVGRRDVVVHSRQQQVVRVTGGMDGEPAHLRSHRDVI